MLRVPSVIPGVAGRIAALEGALEKLSTAPDRIQPDYVPWREEFLRERIEELKRDRG